MKKATNREKGSVTIIEAAFVFPITFFIVFFMIMAGEAYYQNACVEYAVTSTAINGAAQCENPLLSVVTESGVPMDPTAIDVMPYRYIFTSEARKIASEAQGELEEKISGMKPLLFRNMSPQNVSVTIDQKMNPLVSSFPVSCEFEVPLPIKMIFTDQSLSFSYTVNMTASIGDPSEFVRNVALVADMTARSKVISDFCAKIKSAMDKIGEYIN